MKFIKSIFTRLLFSFFFAIVASILGASDVEFLMTGLMGLILFEILKNREVNQ